MSNVTQLTVALSDEMNDLVHSAVASGEYATGAEVIEEALHEWLIRRALSQKEHNPLRQLWSEGIESGPGRLASMEAIKREARRRFVIPPSSDG